MAKYKASSVAKDLGKGAAAFGVGWTIQMLEYYWYAYQTGQHANYPGESVDGFVGYWSPLVSPWNFAGLVTGLALSLVPEKEHSTGREVARLAGYAILGAEGWGYAGHNQNTPSGQAFGLVTQFRGQPGLTEPTYPVIPPDSTRPRSSFYQQSAGPGSASSGPKNFF